MNGNLVKLLRQLNLMGCENSFGQAHALEAVRAIAPHRLSKLIFRNTRKHSFAIRYYTILQSVHELRNKTFSFEIVFPVALE